MYNYKNSKIYFLIKNFASEIFNEQKLKNNPIFECLSILETSVVIKKLDYLEKIYPILELAISWERIKTNLKSCSSYEDYIKKKKNDLRAKNLANFLGARFEIVILGFLSQFFNSQKLQITSLESTRKGDRFDFKGNIKGEYFMADCYYTHLDLQNNLERIKNYLKEKEEKFKSTEVLRILILGLKKSFWKKFPKEHFLKLQNELTNTDYLGVYFYHLSQETKNAMEFHSEFEIFNFINGKEIWDDQIPEKRAHRIIFDEKGNVQIYLERKYIDPEPSFQIAGPEESLNKEKI